jgi:hypothetical protein
MAKSIEKSALLADEPSPTEAGTPNALASPTDSSASGPSTQASGGNGQAEQRPPQPQQAQISVDDSKAVANYANFCRVTGTPEEMIIDFGLNKQPIQVPTEPIAITQRLVVNFYTAKRLLAALQISIQRHEAAFGVLETDIQRRVVPSAWRQGAAARQQ